MIVNLKVKTLDSQTHEFSVDNELTIRQFKDKIEERTRIDAAQQRIIYCGRVLADEKKLKEYDVEGKVVHVAERPPPALRTPPNNNSTTTTTRRDRSEGRGLRTSPLFRALDGMVVGAMAIPMNGSGSPNQTTINSMASSPSFSMNRITVARHMLDCANNIAAYLEDPERGLNNSSLDILAQGRWTMESTLVEVGISDLPQNHTQNLVDVLQGAVSAALRQNGNVTVVQLPSVLGENGADPASEHSDSDNQSSNSGGESGGDGAEPMEELPSEEGAPEGGTEAPNNTETPQGGDTAEETTAENTSAAPAAASATTGEPAANTNQNSATSSRTGTRVLAEVITQMRTVQARLDPFINQYYDLLQTEPTFGENDTAARESSQRLFNRVSEAFHYLSHAQHAISDIMLDMAQPVPRHLSCRPILVEQSGYMSAQNYITHGPTGNGNGHAAHAPRPQTTVSNGITTSTAATTTSTSTISSNVTSTPSATPAATTATPAAAPETTSNDTSATVTTPTTASSNTTTNVEPNPNMFHLSANHQLQVARLLHAVVNSAPIDADFHVQINAPSILSIGVPMSANPRSQAATATATTANTTTSVSTASHTQTSSDQRQPAPTSTVTATVTSPSSTATNSGGNTTGQPRVTTATHPTTSTQTRSTSRPQVQVANIPSSWNARVIPANMMSTFDRFLQCNSHHIQDAEAREQTSNHTSNNHSFPRVQTRILRRVRRPNVNQTPRHPIMPRLTVARASPVRDRVAGQVAHTCNQLSRQLISFIRRTMFDGAPITEAGMSEAVERAVKYINKYTEFLSRYDVHQYNSRASLEKLVRNSLPTLINLINDTQDASNFETRLNTAVKQLFDRINVILFVCVGEVHAGICWIQITQYTLFEVTNGPKNGVNTFFRMQLENYDPEERRQSSIDDVRQFLVPKSVSESPDNEVTPMDTDVSSTSGSPGSSNNVEAIAIPPSEPTENIPSITVGTEPWHKNFVSTWLPVITRDIQRQTRQPPQPPFSDAYISGMSAKRRKLVQSAKPPQDMKSLIADSVRRAIQTTAQQNPSTSNSFQATDEVSDAIATDTTVQASFRETVRSNVEERLKIDSDFKEDKFPHTSQYFKK